MRLFKKKKKKAAHAQYWQTNSSAEATSDQLFKVQI
jgi:hypothetical protein